MRGVGSIFMCYENYVGSGELGCYKVLEIAGPQYPESQLTPVRWITHTCPVKRPSRPSSMAMDYYEAKGLLLWLKEVP